MKMIFFTFIAFYSSCYAVFEYDRAIMSAQKNDFKKSQELLTNIIIDQPEKADALYDLAVSAYKSNEFQSALSYFNKAAGIQNASASLIEQADFNAGNAHVQLKQLHEAIAAYDRVLEKNPQHEKALHNKEVVKKMLEQEKQNQDQKNKDKNEQNEQQDNKDEQNKDQKDNQNKQDQNKEDEQKNQPNKQEQDNKNSDQNDEQKKQEQEKNQNQQNQKLDKKENRSEQQQKQDKNKPEEKETDAAQQTNAGNQDQHKESADAKAKADKQLPAGLARLLNEREKKDAQLNKQMTKALVANQGGRNDYNCW